MLNNPGVKLSLAVNNKNGKYVLYIVEIGPKIIYVVCKMINSVVTLSRLPRLLTLLLSTFSGKRIDI